MNNNSIPQSQKQRVLNIINLKDKFITELRADNEEGARNTFVRLMRLYYEYYNTSIKEEFEGADIERLVSNIGLDFNQAEKDIEADFKSRQVGKRKKIEVEK